MSVSIYIHEIAKRKFPQYINNASLVLINIFLYSVDIRSVIPTINIYNDHLGPRELYDVDKNKYSKVLHLAAS